MLERNQVVIGIVAMLAIGAGTLLAVFGVSGLFQAGFPVTASFTDAAGLQEGAFVTVAGVRSGEVTSVRQVEDHVEVEFHLTSGGVPVDSTVDIGLQNTLGKRILLITPGTSSTYMQEGDHIGMDRTSTPVDLPELGDRSAELLGTTDVEALQELTTALADILDGAEQDVEELITGLDDVTRIVAERREDLATVIDRAEVLIDAAAEKDQEIVAIIDDFGTTLETLVRRRADVQALLRETAAATNAAADLVEDNRPTLDHVLEDVHTALEVVDDHQVDLAHTLPYAAEGFRGFASIGYSGGEAKIRNGYPGQRWGNVFTTNLGEVGINALLDCGGLFDRLFTDLIGPDPACDEVNATDPEVDGSAGASAATEPRSSVGRFFELPGRPEVLR